MTFRHRGSSNTCFPALWSALPCRPHSASLPHGHCLADQSTAWSMAPVPHRLAVEVERPPQVPSLAVLDHQHRLPQLVGRHRSAPPRRTAQPDKFRPAPQTRRTGQHYALQAPCMPCSMTATEQTLGQMKCRDDDTQRRASQAPHEPGSRTQAVKRWRHLDDVAVVRDALQDADLLCAACTASYVRVCTSAVLATNCRGRSICAQAQCIPA